MECVQVMCGVVSKLAALHALGYTHGRVASHGIVRMLHDVNHNVCEARWLLRSLNFVTNIGTYHALKAALEMHACMRFILFLRLKLILIRMKFV